MNLSASNNFQVDISKLNFTPHIAVVKTAWNKDVVNKLEEGVQTVLQKFNVSYTVHTVPGAVEIPFAIQTIYKTIPCNAFIALGAVIRGDTPHFEYVCQSVTQGITMLNTTLLVPTIFGILTVNNMAQAYERLGGKGGHKGEEAALTALQMIELVHQLSFTDKK